MEYIKQFLSSERAKEIEKTRRGQRWGFAPPADPAHAGRVSFFREQGFSEDDRLEKGICGKPRRCLAQEFPAMTEYEVTLISEHFEGIRPTTFEIIGDTSPYDEDGPSSCMTELGRDREEVFRIIEESPNFGGMLVQRKEGDIISRSLLWEWKTGEKLCDRVYAVDSEVRKTHWRHAVSLGYLVRHPNAGDLRVSSTPWFIGEGWHKDYPEAVSLGDEMHKYEKAPYMDTFRWGDSTTLNRSGRGTLMDNHDGGQYNPCCGERCEECDRICETVEVMVDGCRQSLCDDCINSLTYCEGYHEHSSGALEVHTIHRGLVAFASYVSIRHRDDFATADNYSEDTLFSKDELEPLEGGGYIHPALGTEGFLRCPTDDVWAPLDYARGNWHHDFYRGDWYSVDTDLVAVGDKWVHIDSLGSADEYGIIWCSHEDDRWYESALVEPMHTLIDKHGILRCFITGAGYLDFIDSQEKGEIAC